VTLPLRTAQLRRAQGKAATQPSILSARVQEPACITSRYALRMA